jgi:hypothetical protein
MGSLWASLGAFTDDSGLCITAARRLAGSPDLILQTSNNAAIYNIHILVL